MLYKFKSKATGDLIMLEPNGKRVLEIIGKDTGPKGIIEVGQMAGAIAALEAALAQEEATVEEDGKPDVSLRQRAVPFIDMLKRAEKGGADVVWGV